MKTYDTTIDTAYNGQTRGDWPSHSWTVTLTRNGETLTFPYQMGLAHEQTKCGKPKPITTRYRPTPESVCTHVWCAHVGWQPTPPDLYTVLTSLKGDATMGASFNEWCAEYGMDTDSMKAHDLYFACQRSEDEAKRFFGADWTAILDDEDYT